MVIYQRQAIGGPLDGRIVQVPSDDVDRLENPEWQGHYRRVRMSPGVVVFMWFGATPHRWTPKKTPISFAKRLTPAHF